VARICCQLDGIPLAIELAAARLPTLSIEQIADRLSDRFRLLQSGNRTALPRQQTLRATIDWSYSLLAERERILLSQLSIFAGSWNLDAAEAICGVVEPIWATCTDLDVVEALCTLVAHSLVQVEEPKVAGGETRYRLLETMRQYAREHLMAMADPRQLHQRHSDWCVQLAQRAEPELRGPDQVLWLNRLEADHENLRQALQWGLSLSDAEQSLILAAALWQFWYLHDNPSEGREWLAQALAATESQYSPQRAKALNGAGALALMQGDLMAAQPLLEESVQTARATGDEGGRARAITNLANMATYQGDPLRAKSLYEESVTIFRERNDQANVATALYNIGYIVAESGDHDRAIPHLQEGLRLWRELGDRRGVVLALGMLGRVLRGVGEHARAHALLDEGVQIARDLGTADVLRHVLEEVAALECDRGNYHEALICNLECLTAMYKSGQLMGILGCLEGLVQVLAHVQAAGWSNHVAEEQQRAGMDWSWAVHLLGATAATRAAQSLPLMPVARERIEEAASIFRACLGDQRYAVLLAQGQQLPLDDAVALALHSCPHGAVES
jgi:non-specific serine/threonine protein kinase